MCVSKTNDLPKFYKINTTIAIFCLCLKRNTPKVKSYKLVTRYVKIVKFDDRSVKIGMLSPHSVLYAKKRHLQFSRCQLFFKMATIYTKMYDI